jgi:hypothetical protein
MVLHSQLQLSVNDNQSTFILGEAGAILMAET